MNALRALVEEHLARLEVDLHTPTIIALNHNRPWLCIPINMYYGRNHVRLELIGMHGQRVPRPIDPQPVGVRRL